MSASRPAAFTRGPSGEAEVEAARAPRVAPGDPEERRDPRLHPPGTHSPHALAHEDPVVAVEPDDVGDRAERDEVEEVGEVRLRLALEPAAPAELGAEREHHVEHHADTRDRLARERAAGLAGIRRCTRLRGSSSPGR